MSKVKELHDDAIHSLDLAVAADRQGDSTAAINFRRKAFDCEKAAAHLLRDSIGSEPSRSVLYRSAASIGFQCGLFDESEHLIYEALAGNPPRAIGDQLKNLLEDIVFKRHLQLNGVQLDNDEVQISLAGVGIGYGMAPISAVAERLNATNLLLFRTAERRLNRPYRDAGPPTNYVRNAAQAFMSVPRAASFAFSIRVGGTEQASFDGMGSSEQILDDFLDCLELFEHSDRAALSQRIPDQSYFNNFLGLAAAVAPDGDLVTTVGFTALRRGQLREVALRNSSKSIQEKLSGQEVLPSKIAEDSMSEKSKVTREFSGVLKFADSTHDTDMIKLVGDKEFEVVVPSGLMNDVVRPRWNTFVTVIAIKRGTQWIMESIRAGTASVENKANE